MTGTINGENIWITGASSGIGRALALRLAKAGNRVIVSARRTEPLDQLAEWEAGILALPMDVADSNCVDQVKERLQQLLEGQPLHRVILNAGTCEYFDVDSPDWTMFERVMQVNFFGALNCLSIAMPLLVSDKQGIRGHIVAVASQASRAAFPRAEAYGASKAALTYLLQSLSVDLDQRSIDISIVQPGFVDTDMTAVNDFPMPFLMSIEQAAEIIEEEMYKRKTFIRFPKRLSYFLSFAEKFPGLWRRFVAPSLVRNN